MEIVYAKEIFMNYSKIELYKWIFDLFFRLYLYDLEREKMCERIKLSF